MTVHKMNFDAIESAEGDCLEFLRVCFIDVFDTFIAKVVLAIAFVNVIGLTLMQTYYSMYYLDAVHFLKYAPVYFGRFYVMVAISFILFYRNVLYKYYQKVPKWRLDALCKQDKTKIAKEALYVTLSCCLAIIVGVCTGVLYVVPSEEDHEIFFIMTWFEDNLLEWADILSFFHRLSFPFASFLMQTPCIQLCYTLSHLQYQMKIFIRLVENLNTGYEDTDLDHLIFDADYHKEIKRRLIFCMKRHTEIINTGHSILRAGKLFVFLFAISGGVLGISMLMFIFFLQGVPTFTYIRFGSLIFVAALTFVMYIIQGQRTEDIGNELYDVLCGSKWYYWNKQNQQMYLIFLINSSTPFKLKFSDKLSVCYSLGVDMMKAIYSMSSLMAYFRDSILKRN